MITDEEVMRLFERADPARVEDADSVPSAARYLDALAARSSEVTLAASESARNERAGRRWPVIAVAAVVAAGLVAAGTVLVTRTGGDDTRIEPAGSRPVPTEAPTTPPTVERLSGDLVAIPSTVPGDLSTEAPLLPDGVPSTPLRSELVASVTSYAKGLAYRLYGDGRLIWAQHDDGQGGYVWVEQRLTPAGVERVRSAFVASGLFDLAQSASDAKPCDFTTGAYDHAVCVRDGDHWLRADDPDIGLRYPGDRLAPAAAGLFDYLGALDSSLPASEWADQQITPYVPGRIGVCISTYVDGVEVPLDLFVLLPRFPERATELLAGQEPGSPAPGSCAFDLTLDEARTLADAFLGPSGGGTHAYFGIVIRSDDQSDPGEPDTAFITFEARFPDGIPTGYPFLP